MYRRKERKRREDQYDNNLLAVTVFKKLSTHENFDCE